VLLYFWYAKTKEEKLTWSQFVLFCHVQPENLPVLTAETAMEDLWTAQMMSFIHHARATLRFAKKIPG